MVSLEPVHQNPLVSIDSPSSPRISFQADFLEAAIFRSSTITPESEEDDEQNPERAFHNSSDFEFLSSNNLSLINNNSSNNNVNNNITLLTADELFSEGKILPFWQMQQHSEKLKKISLRAKEEEEGEEDGEKENDPVKEEEEQVKKEGEESNKVMNWLVDEDPSPRPPNCTVLWKELLRLKKQRSSSSSVSVLSPSSSSSSSSSSLSADTTSREKKQVMKGMKKLERTRSSSTSIRIRPMINVPICTQVKTSSLPPLFSSHKKRK